MQPSLVIKQGANAAQVIQPLTQQVVAVNSNMSGSIPNVVNLNQAGAQNVVVNPQNLGQPTRVIIGTPQMVGTQAVAPGIPMQTLQSLQTCPLNSHYLIKTETGQYQLLRITHGPVANIVAAAPSQAIRLSPVPALQGVATVPTNMVPPGAMEAHMQFQMHTQLHGQLQAQMQAQLQGQMQAQLQGPMQAQMQGPMQAQMQVQFQGPMPPMALASGSGAGLAAAPPQLYQPLQNAVTYVKSSDHTKEKCRNFFVNLLELSSKEPPAVDASVRNLIQELIDVQLDPDTFCVRLESLLNATPQPSLIAFLKKSLPLLRESMVSNEVVIEGLNPPQQQMVFPEAEQPGVASCSGIQQNQKKKKKSKKAAARKAAFRIGLRCQKLPSQPPKISLTVNEEFVFKKPLKPAPKKKPAPEYEDCISEFLTIKPKKTSNDEDNVDPLPDQPELQEEAPIENEPELEPEAAVATYNIEGHFMNFTQSLLKELNDLPVALALRLQIQIQESIDDAKKDAEQSVEVEESTNVFVVSGVESVVYSYDGNLN